MTDQLTLDVDRPDAPAIGRSHAIDPGTSRRAAALNAPRAGTQRGQCLAAIAAAGEHGATWDELEVTLGMYSAQKRVSELKLTGWIEPSGRRPTRRGALAEAYVLTAKAREWMRTAA